MSSYSDYGEGPYLTIDDDTGSEQDTIDSSTDLDLTTDNTDSEPDLTIYNTGSELVRSLCAFRFRSDFSLRDQEYDSWDAIGLYAVQVIPSSASLPGHSSPSIEEFRR